MMRRADAGSGSNGSNGGAIGRLFPLAIPPSAFESVVAMLGAVFVFGREAKAKEGSAATTNHWHDKVYLSLTPQVTDDSILIQDLGNQAALDKGEQYTATTVPVVVPLRYRGQVYVIVVADACASVRKRNSHLLKLGLANSCSQAKFKAAIGKQIERGRFPG